MRQQTVNIAGGGLAGALLAVMLAHRGIAVNVFERRPDPRERAADTGRSINLALAARGIAALDHAELMPQVRPTMLPMRGRMIHDRGADSKPHLLPYGQRDDEIIYSVGRAALNTVLIEAAARLPQVALHFDSTCTSIDPESGALCVQDNATGIVRTINDAVTIATDGAGSAIRTGLARAGRIAVKESPLAHDYKELHIAPSGVDYALYPQALHVWPRHGYMLIALPNPDRSFTATLFAPHTGEPGFNTLGTDTAVQEFFEREFPTAAALIPNLTLQFRKHPQGHLGTVHADPWACGGTLLLGDAAHAIVPFHGQGMNAAFEDCRVLDRLISEAGTQPDWPALFAAFDARRRLDTEAIAAMALENYAEMRSAVLDARFLRQKAWALQLERLYPERFIPRYAMVMFHPEISYSEALRRGGVQQLILDVLDQERSTSAEHDSPQLNAAELARARTLVAAHL